MQSKGMIGVTQPRRVAAVSVAERVATELGESYKGRVAHQVRYDTNVSRDTAIKFMTDGILLREISQDFILSKYSSIVLDEAHERSVNTDILIGMLSRIVRLRSELAREQPERYYPLKLVVMSATLRVSDFAENPRLFIGGAPPIVQAEGRQFPVEVHWSRKTQRDFVSEAVSKVARGHRKLPPGSMLVFLTSQNEIQVTAKRLKEKLGGANNATYGFGKAKEEAKHRPLEADDFEDDNARRNNDYLEGEEDANSDSEPEITGLDSEADDAEFNIAEEESHFGPRDRGVLKPHILPLYAALPSAQQLKVFQPPPPGHRLIVLATNVAETSLTIPGVRYVFDSGRAKEKRYDLSTGVQTFEIDWISKASASQRAGRAGRTGPGHVYRLYSSAVYEQFFAEHTVPEILRTPLESTVLQLKAMDIDNVVNFPFPTSPDTNQLAQAERLLKNLGAISERDGTITERGSEMMGYPVSPRFAKMLILAKMNGILDLAVAVVAGLAVGDLFIQEAQAANEDDVGDDDNSTNDDDSDAETRREKRQMQTAAQTAARKRHQAFTSAQAKLARRDDKSDVAKLLTAIAVHAEKSGKDQPMSAASTFCEEFFLREKGMSEVQQLRRQLQNIVSARQATSVPSSTAAPFHDILPKPTDKDLARLNQIVAAGFLDQIAIRADLLPSASETLSAFGRKPRRALEVPYQTLLPSAEVDKSLSPQDQELQRSVFLHPSSVLAKLTVGEMP
ncbi:P-loop containing nucleoside triphosphate hydrolase protein, partial [Hortaea werneckii]